MREEIMVSSVSIPCGGYYTRLSCKKCRYFCISFLCSWIVLKRLLCLTDSTKARWFQCIWLHIAKNKSGPSILYSASNCLWRRAVNSGVSELKRKRANKRKLYSCVPLVFHRIAVCSTFHDVMARCLANSKVTWEKFLTRSIDFPSTVRNVALNHTSFWRHRCIKFSVGINWSGEPSYFCERPAHAICSKRALS